MKPELLITTNGFRGTWPAIEYGAWLAATMQTKVLLLGVTERLNPAQIDDHHPLDEVFARASELFQQKGLEYNLEIQNGDAEDVIPRKAKEGNFITVVGPLGRPQIRHWLIGRSIRHFMEMIAGPILYVPGLRLPLNKLLIGVGGLGYEVAAENLAFQLAVVNQAEVTLLHVVPPVDLDYPTTRAVRENWKHLVDTDTLPGRYLRQALVTAEEAGLKASVNVRRGNVVEEILAEMKEGNYDLVCMGSPYSANALRQLYVPNVTADVAEVAHCPVLTARHKREDLPT